jgi:D-arabinose 1-dehydrogenase-like Zn-dependent alcohol dehydrogenase
VVDRGLINREVKTMTINGLGSAEQPARDADLEAIRVQDINEAYEHRLKSDVKYCWVIDMGSIKASNHQARN